MRSSPLQAFPWFLALLLFLLVTLYSSYHRQPWADEGWFSDAAYHLANYGFMGTPSLEPQTYDLPGIAQRTYWVQPLYLVGQGAWFLIFPSNALGARAFSIFWALVALWAFHELAHRLAGERVAQLGTVLLAFNYFFLDNATFARPEMMCAALGLGAMAVYVRFREARLLLALAASNLLMAACGLTHPNALLHLVGLMILVLWFDRRRLQWRHVAAVAGVYVFAAACWGLYIAQDPDAWLAQLKGNSYKRVSKSFNPVLILWDEVHSRYLRAYGLLSPQMVVHLKALTLMAFITSIVACVKQEIRRRPGVSLVLTLLATYFVIQSVFNQKLSNYLVHIVPLYVFLLANFVVWLWDRKPNLRWVWAAAVLALILLDTGGILLREWRRSDVDSQQRLVRYLSEHASEATRIFGSSSLLYMLDYDTRLLDDPYLGVTSGKDAEVLVVVDPLYTGLYEAWPTEASRAEVWPRVAARLEEYGPVFEAGKYRVYFHRSFGGP